MNRKVLVTGAAGGIGIEIVKRFLSEGDSVLAVGHLKKGALETLKLSLETAPTRHAQSPRDRLHIFYADLSTVQGVEETMKEAVRVFGAVDILVNNAGMAYDTLFQDSKDEEYRKILDTNLSSAVRLSKAVLPSMIQRQLGRIINVSSIYGSVGASMEVEYAVTKGGIEALTRSLAKEVGPSGISVNAVAPGLIDTPMNSSYTKEEINELLEEIPLGRFGRPAEVADLVYYLSVAPKYLTGQVIRIDGGWM